MKAFRKINTLITNPKFYVFSDDIEYTKVLFKDFLKYDIFFVPKDNRDWFHMFVMSYCKNFIISNSSYSWWASFLSKEANNKIICPKYWQRNKLTKSIGIYRKDFLLM